MAQHPRLIERIARVRNIYYGWKLVGLTFLLIGMVSGTTWYGVGLWVKALELQFGWSRTQLTGAFSLAQLEGGLIGPLIGYMTDRLGAGKMVLIGISASGIGFIAFSRTANLTTFYISFTLIMLGSTAGSWLPLMAAINRWFIRRRSTAMAVAGEGSFLGGLTLTPLLALAVASDQIGWRTSSLGIGIVFLVAAWLFSRLIRDQPEEGHRPPDGEAELAPKGARQEAAHPPDAGKAPSIQPELTARQALRTSSFWFISLGHALSSMLIGTLTVHLIPMLTDKGFSLQMAALVWSMTMAAGAVFQLVGGYAGDRLPKNVAIFPFTILQAAGFVVVAFVHTLPMAAVFALLYGAGFGGRVPLTTSIRGDYFGQRAFATITGLSMMPLYGFMLAAPLFAAYMFDTRGSYTLAFLVLAALSALSGPLFLFARSHRRNKSQKQRYLFCTPSLPREHSGRPSRVTDSHPRRVRNGTAIPPSFRPVSAW